MLVSPLLTFEAKSFILINNYLFELQGRINEQSKSKNVLLEVKQSKVIILPTNHILKTNFEQKKIFFCIKRLPQLVYFLQNQTAGFWESNLHCTRRNISKRNETRSSECASSKLLV